MFNLFNFGRKKRQQVVYELIMMTLNNNGKYTTENIYYEAIVKFVEENNGTIINSNCSYIIIDGDRVEFFNPHSDIVEISIINNIEYEKDIIDKATGRGQYQLQSDYEYILNSLNNFNGKKALRLKFKNIGQSLTALWDKNIKTYNINHIDHFIIANKVYGLYVSENIYINITDFSYEQKPRDIEWLNKQKNIIEARNKRLKQEIDRLKVEDDDPYNLPF